MHLIPNGLVRRAAAPTAINAKYFRSMNIVLPL
jgi:hypothetical protein